MTTDGKVGPLSSEDITDFSVAYDYGASQASITKGVYGGGAEVLGNVLVATPTDLLLTAAPGGGTLDFYAEDGYDVFESLSDPVCFSSPCSMSDPPALNFYRQANLQGQVTGSIPFTAATMPIGTVTPEPGTALLYLLGLAAMVFLRKRIAFLA